MAINQALSFVEHDTTNRPVPLHLRNAPTKLMDQAGYGKGYKYAHDYGGFAGLEFMPETLKGKKFYERTPATPPKRRSPHASGSCGRTNINNSRRHNAFRHS